MKEKKKIDFRYNIKIYLNLLMKYKLLFIVLLILILFSEGSRIIDRYIFKVLIDQGTEFLEGRIILSYYTKILLILAVVFIALLIIRSLVEWLNMHIINILDSYLILDLKRKFFNHIIHLSYDFYTSHKTGSLISRLVRGSRAVERLTDTIVFNFAPLFFQIIVVVGSVMYFDKISALILVLIIIIFIILNVAVNYIRQEANIEANDAEDFEKAIISDIFTNIESIKHYGKEDLIKEKFANISESTRKAVLKGWHYFRWINLGQSLILSIGTLLLVYFPLLKLLNNEISIGTLVFIYTTYGMIINPLYAFVHGLRDFYTIMADFHSLFQYKKIENNIKDFPNSKDLIIHKGGIKFKNISFKYKNRYILSNFNLRIPQNKKIALVGPSGSGKSTIIRLLYRLYDPKEGVILIDEKDIKNFKQESLRSELSIVPQECILFDDTIYNNILFSNPHAQKEEVFRAIKFAQLDELINNLPNKEKTIVGERGIKLSTGEKQRVSIARALLANKKILVLDEATSSLDSETEHEIQKDLEELMQNRTSIIIAHRLSTIMKADLIIVLDKGKIVQKGKHEELIKQKGLYKKLWSLQKGGYI